MNKIWPRIALLSFFLAAVLGILMRYIFVEEVSWVSFRDILHAHSSLALIGWCTLLLIYFIDISILHSNQQKKSVSNFWPLLMILSVASVVAGYLVFKKMQVVIISFIIFNISVYGIILSFSSRMRGEVRNKNKIPLLFIFGAFFFLILSTAGVFLMCFSWQFEGIGHIWYYAGEHTFFHFMMNGWLLFGAFSLIFEAMKRKGIELLSRNLQIFFWLLFSSCLLTFFLVIAWVYEDNWAFILNSAGSGLQLAALILFWNIAGSKNTLTKLCHNKWERFLILIAFLSWIVKVLIQTASGIPYLATIGYTIRNLMIGYFHLQLLGVISIFFIAYAIRQNIFDISSSLSRNSLVLFITGFSISELILFIQGLMFWGNNGFLPYYYKAMFIASALMPLGVFLFFIAQIAGKHEHQ